MIIRPTDDDMLDAACEIFAEAGFHTATMDDIATRAKSTKPTLYAHFGSKEDLYRICAERAADYLGRHLSQAYAAAAELRMDEQVRAGVVALFDFAAGHPAHFELLFGTDPAGVVADARHRLTITATSEIAGRIRNYTERRGRGRWGISAELCAALMLGLSVEGARCALRTESLDPTAAGEFATHFAVSALRHLDPEMAAALDREAAGPDPA